VFILDLATMAVVTPAVLILASVATMFALWKRSKVIQLDPQEIERLFDLRVDTRWNGIERRSGIDRRSGKDRRGGTDRRQSTR
jgi:uncharacterized membrane-anchored protein